MRPHDVLHLSLVMNGGMRQSAASHDSAAGHDSAGHASARSGPRDFSRVGRGLVSSIDVLAQLFDSGGALLEHRPDVCFP